MNEVDMMKRRMSTFLVGCLIWCGTWSGGVHAETSSAHQTTWTIQQGMTLHEIARKAYGHHAYVRMIALYNDIDSAESLTVGETIQTPELLDLFQDIGLIPPYGKAFKRVFYVIDEYQHIIPEYLTAVKLSKESDGYVNIPEPLIIRLNILASMLEKTVAEIEQMTEATGNTPKMTLRQATNAAYGLRRLAQGYFIDYKELDMLEQHLAHVLVNAVAWSKE
jgi:hypothetical protein